MERWRPPNHLPLVTHISHFSFSRLSPLFDIFADSFKMWHSVVNRNTLGPQYAHIQISIEKTRTHRKLQFEPNAHSISIMSQSFARMFYRICTWFACYFTAQKAPAANMESRCIVTVQIKLRVGRVKVSRKHMIHEARHVRIQFVLFSDCIWGRWNIYKWTVISMI